MARNDRPGQRVAGMNGAPTKIDDVEMDAIVHGGRLHAAAVDYGIPVSQWLDLSTGINPAPWPVPPIPAWSWTRLPETEDGLAQAAQHYYGATHALPVAGSQAAIQALPTLRAQPSRVGVLTPAYAEHAHAWQRCGHHVIALAAQEIDQAINILDVLVVVNPNNPTGQRFTPTILMRWHAQLAARGGWLVVDEAFMDVTPEASLAWATHRTGLVVLRSLGKFFGLAGARVGFVLAEPTLLRRLHRQLGPWAVAGPARAVALRALHDQTWQVAARVQLAQAAQRLTTLLSQHGLATSGGTALFQWIQTPRAAYLHRHLAQHAVLTRLFDEPPSLRFGLPGDEADWARLVAALRDLRVVTNCL